MKYIIFGLGNIGKEYELTRHNIGFLVLDFIADKFKAKFETKKLGDVALFTYKGRQIYLVKPSTYMNLSGKTVNYYMQQLKVPKERMLVITDDIALPFGKVRLKSKGSNGGHNGLGSIQETLQTKEYARLKFGIGDDYSKGQQADYVLSNFNAEEMTHITEPITQAAEATIAFCTIGIARAMNAHN